MHIPSTTTKRRGLEVVTGLHIGAGDQEFEIGGLDNPIVRIRFAGKHDGVPYIPGSSLKGKLRALTPKEEGWIYGTNDEKKGPTRVIVRDAYPLDGTEAETEIKTEVSIDRKTGKGSNPRPMERIVPGSKFSVEFILNIYDGDDENLMKEMVEKAMHLLEEDYLGGSGSRGYGKIKFSGIEWKEIWKKE